MGFEQLFSGGLYRGLLDNDFNIGYAAGAGLVIGLLILLLVLRIILRLLFRKRRCSSIVVPDADGELTISRDAVEKAARSVLDEFGELDVRRIQLYRQGRSYSLLLYCTFIGGGKGLPEVSGVIRPRLIETLRKLFGIASLRKVQFRIDTLEEAPAPEIHAPAVPVKRFEPADDANADSGI
ncbi:MAG: hypothetical protein HPZ91_09660 [Lentisphaeria bacterium]|nr:hypothetical protein [Lentisphaeria bacterium]